MKFSAFLLLSLFAIGQAKLGHKKAVNKKNEKAANKVKEEHRDLGKTEIVDVYEQDRRLVGDEFAGMDIKQGGIRKPIVKIPYGKCKTFVLIIKLHILTGQMNYDVGMMEEPGHVKIPDTFSSQGRSFVQADFGKVIIIKHEIEICCKGAYLKGLLAEKSEAQVCGAAETARSSAMTKVIKVICVPHGGGNGDPHMKLWSGRHYDYHGECDLVFLRAPKLDLEMHARTEIQDHFSFIAETAVKIGKDVLEVHRDGKWLLNGEEGGSLENGIGGHKIAYVPPDLNASGQHIMQIYLGDHGNKGKIRIRSFRGFMFVSVEGADFESLNDSSGMFGEFPSGRMLGRDGTLIKNTNDFGQEWQVGKDDSVLFSTPPKNEGKCRLPTPKSRKRRLAESLVTESDAEQACADLETPEERENCKYDVIATGDVDMASAYAG